MTLHKTFEIIFRVTSLPSFTSCIPLLQGRNPEALSSAVAKLESLIGASSSVKVDGLLLDVSSASSISSAVSQLSAKYGRIDVLVNNAGVSTPRSKKDKVEMFLKTEETEMDDMMEIFQTNVAGVVELTNKMIPLFRGSKSPKVVNGEFPFSDLGQEHWDSCLVKWLVLTFRFPLFRLSHSSLISARFSELRIFFGTC